MSLSSSPTDTVVTHVLAGNFIIELIEDADAFCRDDWGSDDSEVRVQPGRVGLESIDELHLPEIRLRGFAQRPTDTPSGELGTWPVAFATGRVEIWGGDADVAELALNLPQSPNNRYLMRVTRERKDIGEQDADDYTLACYERDGEPTRDLERFTVDFWPATVMRPEH